MPNYCVPWRKPFVVQVLGSRKSKASLTLARFFFPQCPEIGVPNCAILVSRIQDDAYATLEASRFKGGDTAVLLRVSA